LVLTGPSGAGKTTLIHGLLGWVPESRGDVTWNGARLETLDRGALANRIGFLDQDARCFGRSIRENLTLGAKVTDERLEHALELAGALDFVERRGGLDTELDESADDLSGGQ